MKQDLRYYSISVSSKHNYYWLSVIITIVSIIVGCYIIQQGTQGIYKYIYMLPFMYALFTIIFFPIYTKLTLVTCIIQAFMFVRYVVSPFLVAVDGFPEGIYRITVNSYYMRCATVIMVYEMFIIFIGLWGTSKKEVVAVSDERYAKVLISRKNFQQFNLIIKGLIIFTIIIYVIWPTLFSNYSFIINNNLDSLILYMAESQRSLPHGMRWIGYTCGEIVRNIVIEYMLIWFYKRHNETGKNTYWVFTLIMISINGLITTSRIMLGLLTSVVFFVQVIYLYPQKRKVMLRVGICAGIIIIFMIILSYWSNVLKYHAISQLVQGYTNGFYNVYQALVAYAEVGQTIFDKYWMMIMGDGLGNVNVLSMFIEGDNSSDIYNHYIYGKNFNGGAVVPYVSQMSYYFTPFIGPWFTLLCVNTAVRCENKWKTLNGNILCNGMMSVTFATVPFMYNMSTLIHIMTIMILPIWITYIINSRFAWKLK